MPWKFILSMPCAWEGRIAPLWQIWTVSGGVSKWEVFGSLCNVVSSISALH